jgi:hypothetical protein
MGYLIMAAGLILFIIGVVGAVKTGSFTLFYVFGFSGFALALWGLSTLKKARQEQIKGRTTAQVDRIATARSVPTKKCPGCGGAVEVSSRLCPLCGHAFQVTYTLTVFTPFDVSKREGLIKYLMTRMKKTYEEIAIQLEKGMVFRYSNKEDSEKSRKSFENLGCKVKEGEIVSNT